MSLPELCEDVIEEILLRLPPANPALLVRLHHVCKAWRRLLTDPTFLPRFLALHRRPPVLGFLCNEREDYPPAVRAAFVSTSAFSPPHRDLDGWRVLDSRHGRVLFHTMECRDPGIMDLYVWDPITDELRGFATPPIDYSYHNAAVLCAAAADGCDHLDCHGGAFLVVFLGTDGDYGIASAFVYSSESGKWRDPTADEQVPLADEPDMMPTLLIGNTLYFLCQFGSGLVQYDLGAKALSVMDLPRLGKRALSGVLITAEDGRLGFAGAAGTRILLWSRKPRPDGAMGWAPHRFFQFPDSQMLDAIGFAEGFGVIFVRTDAGVCTIDLKSLQFSRVSTRDGVGAVFPYMSFYTPDHVRRAGA